MENLSADIFIKHITYLPFTDVINLCHTNKKFHTYCTYPKYRIPWKALVLNTFGNIDNYQEKLEKTWLGLGLDKDSYNYMVYVNLVKTLDPITQLTIYYKQGDMVSFDSDMFNLTQRFLTLFLLGKKESMKEYLPSQAYQPFIAMLDNKTISQNDLNKMLVKHTGQKIAKIQKDTERDYFMSAIEAKKYGIIDKVLSERPLVEEVVENGK